MSTSALQFKIATEDWEFEQIHELNYRTFVEEIPQHQPAEQPRLVDKFHEENTYLICVAGNRVVGMLAARGRRPFSLDQKLANLDSFLPPGAEALRGALAGGGEGFSQQPGLPWHHLADVAVWDGAGL